MLANSGKRDVTNSIDNVDSDNGEYPTNEYRSSMFCESSFKPAENENESDIGARNFPGGPALIYNEPDRLSHPAEEWTSPYTFKKSWNGHPRIKISSKSKEKKSRNRKAPGGLPPRKKQISSPHGNNILKTRLKYGVSSSNKKSSLPKQRKKLLNLAIMRNSVNGLDRSSMAEDHIAADDVLVSNQPNKETNEVTRLLRHDYDGGGEGEYAQYLELKPSVKFRCYRCGMNDFSSMALLQEHIIGCDGRTQASVTSNLPSEMATSIPDPSYPPVARNLKIKRKVLLCSSCGTYYQHYNLYIHMRDTHNKQICLFCRNTFHRPQQLWDHLVDVHKLNSVAYSNAAQVRNAFKSFYITCCTCNFVFSDEDRFDKHKCVIERPKEDTFCSDCRTQNEMEPAISVEKRVDERSPVRPEQYQRGESTGEDEAGYTSPADGEDAGPGNSTLDVIGVSEEHTVTSLQDEVETKEVAAALDVKVEDSSLTSEPCSEMDVQPETSARLPEESETFTSSEDVKPVVSSPVQLPEETRYIPADEEGVAPADGANEGLVEDTKDRLVDESKDGLVEDSRDGCAEDTQEPIAVDTRNTIENDLRMSSDEDDDAVEAQVDSPPSEPASSPKAEPKTSIWLASDDETEPPAVQPKESPVKETEVSPQPLTMALMLDDTVTSLSAQTVIKECVRTSCSVCLYCNNATIIAINGSQLASHIRTEHRYLPTKHEDDGQHVIQKIEEGIEDLKDVYMTVSSSATMLTEFDGVFACLQCSFSSPLFKDLCHHKRKMHHKVLFPCIMCKCSFSHYSQLLCHLCPGVYSFEVQNSLNYHCAFCSLDSIPSAFRLMVHLRKIHQACDICLARHNDQAELFSHMIKQHKMNHLCYKCNLAYRSRDGINEHLFWKHGTESVLCKRCLQKKWPHAYHFCIPASTYTCEECSRIFTKAVALTVHRRAHNGEFPFACTECDRRFISKKLLSVHNRDAHNIMPPQLECEASREESNGKQPEQVNGFGNGTDEGKKRRKKKRKKLKTDIEKPLLDELPPLNLSSESEEDSAEEEASKPPSEPVEQPVEPLQPSPPPSPKEPTVPAVYDIFPVVEVAKNEEMRTGIPETPAMPGNNSLIKSSSENATQNDTSAEVPHSEAKPLRESEPTPAPEPESEENTLERIRNCLIVEHSYCIPDSIFRSEGPDSSHSAAENSLEGTSTKPEESPKPSSKPRDKSCCKSITPRKHKHGNGVKHDSSSSESSSDSDSSSSSCGSNCSCNQKSNSNCSSSSSGSEYSTTPDKKKKKKKSKTANEEEKVETAVVNDEDESRREQFSLLNVRESDLETEICTSDEDFYDQHPSTVPQVVPKPDVLPAPLVSPTQPQVVPTRAPAPAPGRERKNRKRRRAPKITINLGSQANRLTMPPSSNFAIHLNRVDRPQSPIHHSYTPNPSAGAPPGIYLSKNTPTSTYATTYTSTYASSVPSSTPTYSVVNSSDGGQSHDSSGRRSKRERVKNKFYGYSSSDEASGQESFKVAPVKKRPPAAKRPPKARPGFVGIRAKKPLIMPTKRAPPSTPPVTNTMAITHPSLPPHLYRMPSYITQQQQQHHQQQQQQQQLYQQQQIHQQQQLQLQQQQQQYRHYQKSPSTNSSDDSDTDNLVINEPSVNERLVNNQPRYKLPVYPSDLAAPSNNWQQRSDVPAQFVPNQSAVPSQNEDVRVYCFCKCPYDEVSEMIACDGENCEIEWFHFECVGIMVAPKGKWYCKDCRKKREAMSRSFL